VKGRMMKEMKVCGETKTDTADELKGDSF